MRRTERFRRFSVVLGWCTTNITKVKRVANPTLNIIWQSADGCDDACRQSPKKIGSLDPALLRENGDQLDETMNLGYSSTIHHFDELQTGCDWVRRWLRLLLLILLSATVRQMLSCVGKRRENSNRSESAWAHNQEKRGAQRTLVRLKRAFIFHNQTIERGLNTVG